MPKSKVKPIKVDPARRDEVYKAQQAEIKRKEKIRQTS
jgi:hypothetical protein